MLEIKGLTKYFGGLAAVNGLDLRVNQKEIMGLIGPNGAGKTTVFNLITGFLRPTRGRVLFDQVDITGKSPHSIAAKGLVRTFQLTGIFPDLTVLQNVAASCYLNPKIRWWEAIVGNSRSNKNEETFLSNAMEILKFVGLDDVRDELARNLPHGHQRMLGIAIALAANPKILLLDEPLSGMNIEETTKALDLIREIWARGAAVLLIEHNVTAVMNICDRIAVLNFGKKIAEGLPEEVAQNKDVIEAYLGADYAT